MDKDVMTAAHAVQPESKCFCASHHFRESNIPGSAQQLLQQLALLHSVLQSLTRLILFLHNTFGPHVCGIKHPTTIRSESCVSNRITVAANWPAKGWRNNVPDSRYDPMFALCGPADHRAVAFRCDPPLTGMALSAQPSLGHQNFGLFFLGNRYVVRPTRYYAGIRTDVKRDALGAWSLCPIMGLLSPSGSTQK